MGIITIKGIRFDLVPHVARGAGGSAWSAYVEGTDEPFHAIQRRTRSELVHALKVALGAVEPNEHKAGQK